MTRRSIEIESFVHSNPIPAATRIGPLVVCMLPAFVLLTLVPVLSRTIRGLDLG